MQCYPHHLKLNDEGEGKCSVPMWRNGLPAGFCDKVAYGEQKPDGRLFSYDGYVPGLACYVHGGPQKK